MTLALAFWVLMLVWLAFGLYSNRATLTNWAGDHLVLFILLALLGWAVFGAAIKH